MWEYSSFPAHVGHFFSGVNVFYWAIAKCQRDKCLGFVRRLHIYWQFAISWRHLLIFTFLNRLLTPACS